LAKLPNSGSGSVTTSIFFDIASNDSEGYHQ
jgi:hypothetical protein